MLLRDERIKKESGILLHLSSLPSKYGIGSLGKEAYRFIDFLKDSCQSYWQLLPLVPLGGGNSPYKSASCYAGEILYIDIDLLVDDGLIDENDIPKKVFEGNVDFDGVREFKLPLIRKATQNFDTTSPEYIAFLNKNNYWLEDFAVFMCAVEHSPTHRLADLNDGIKYRFPDALSDFKVCFKEEIEFYKITQFIFYSQYYRLKSYAQKNGISLIGDIPFYVSEDSSDVWENPDNFMLSRDLKPALVAGVPPDMFSSTGQLWGNPIYDWDYLKETGYDWWIRRIAHCLDMYDMVRIDHFRAFADYYVIPATSQNATSGHWQTGAGTDFWQHVKKQLGNMSVIAEDLGSYSPQVQELIQKTGFPNMKVLQFAFSGGADNPHLPKNYNENCVCYTGTHDNDTTLGWYESASQYEKTATDFISPHDKLPIPYNLINTAMQSKARLVIIPMQDWLGLDSTARLNTPGTPKGNWAWRMPENYDTAQLKMLIKSLSAGRN